uniref:Reverse transcriptase Ty1/copia-type domain-containing protein n=1 Tax=Fagus sylvatica TaxID=28930 RepID=A0A2N9FHB2_FAGSY
MDLLFCTKFQDVKPVSTPAQTGKKLSLHDGDPLQNLEEYHSIVGALKYLTITRLDISVTVNQVRQFMHQPSTTHWTAIKRILCFLKHTSDHELLYRPGPLRLEAYSVADYAGNPDDHHSVGSYYIYLGPNPISWNAKKHRNVSRSSTEAEYCQLAYTAAEISWLSSLFKDLVFYARTKHLEVDYHYVRDKVTCKELEVNYICTTDQVADVFTKGLSSTRFMLLKFKLMACCLPISLRGCDTQFMERINSNSNVCQVKPPDINH